jgi:hypothetical protein
MQRRLLTVIGQCFSLPTQKAYDGRGKTTSSFWVSTSNDDDALTDRAEFLDVCCVDPFEKLSKFASLADDSTSAA